MAFVWTRRGGDVTVVPAGSLDSPVSKRFIRVDTEGVFMLSFPNFLFRVMHENTATVTANAVRISSKNNILHQNRRSAQKEQILAKN